MNQHGSDYRKLKNLIKLAEAVVTTAIEDAANGSNEARIFIESEYFDVWCDRAALDADKLRGMLRRILKSTD